MCLSVNITEISPKSFIRLEVFGNLYRDIPGILLYAIQVRLRYPPTALASANGAGEYTEKI